MATPTDPTFGAGFDADVFRNAIISTMEMGMPSDTSERVTFRWKEHKDYAIEDPAGSPYTFTATPTASIAERTVQVPAAVEFVSRASLGDGTPWGNFDSPKVILTLLDEQYALVTGADEVLIDGATYEINYTAPPMGLFSVTVYQLYCSAVDES